MGPHSGRVAFFHKVRGGQFASGQATNARRPARGRPGTAAMGDNTKLSSAADFFPAALREHATEFNRLRAMPSSPQRTTACDQLVNKALTKCMELGASGSVLESVVDDALKGRCASNWRHTGALLLLTAPEIM